VKYLFVLNAPPQGIGALLIGRIPRLRNEPDG
jgi:hypothetical protein